MSSWDIGLVFEKESYAIRGAVFEVYREMGNGFLEAVYQECMEIELRNREIPFISQKEIQLAYKGEKLKNTYIPDLICFDKIIVELKVVKEIRDEHKAQVINYLKVTNFKLGLLINFGSSPKVQIERLVL